MNKYEFDTERWLRSNAEFYSRNGNLMVARNLELAADDFAALRLRAEQAEARCKRLEEFVQYVIDKNYALTKAAMFESARKALEDK